jgi:hypothetical protein
VFWQIDHTGIPRAAKLMKYLMDGHRDKTQHPGWIYNQDGCRQQLEPDKHTIVKPLFGSHLLNRYPQAEVNIVESEKTAIIMANYYGNPERRLWLACGGLQWLQLDKFQPLIDQGRTIWLWPDKDGRDAWQEVADKLGYDKCRVYTQFFDSCWQEEDGDKADVADIAIRMMRTGDKPRTKYGNKPDGVSDQEWQEHLAIMRDLEEYNRTHPADEGFYEPDDVKQHTGKIQHIAEIINGNPYVQKLIKKLNLEVINEQP